MSTTSDELREYCKGLYKGGPNYMTLMAIADRIDAEMVELPKDADGEYIHIGDVMWQKGRITKRACKAIMGDAYVMLDGIQGAVYAKGLTHYHAPTVEDVLREYALKCEEAGNSGPEVKRLATEYAARLMLAGEDA